MLVTKSKIEIMLKVRRLVDLRYCLSWVEADLTYCSSWVEADLTYCLSWVEADLTYCSSWEVMRKRGRRFI